MKHNYYLYIQTTTNNKKMLIGITNIKQQIIAEHKQRVSEVFFEKNNFTKLVYYEIIEDLALAMQRKKEIENWRLEKKKKLVEALNPMWSDLSESLFCEIFQATNKIKISGLVISAGLSSRMGSFKPLLHYKNKSFMMNILSKLDFVCDEIIVVTGHNRELIETELRTFPTINRIKTVVNKNYKEGMLSSLQSGLRKLLDSNWVLYHFVDQPTLPIIFYKYFITQIDNRFDWIQPTYNGKNGHPILIHKRVVEKIIEASAKSNLKELTQSSNIKKKYWNCNYPEIHDDVDTIERYNNLSK